LLVFDGKFLQGQIRNCSPLQASTESFSKEKKDFELLTSARLETLNKILNKKETNLYSALTDKKILF
jgi:hypothetical protein